MRFPRPARGARWLLRQQITYDFLISVFAGGVGVAATLNYLAQGRPLLAVLVGIGTAGVLAFTFVKHAIGLVKLRREESTYELEGCLYTLHAVLQPGHGARLRLAIHIPIDESLEQITEYIGDRPKPGRVGRQFPSNAGIIGKAYRENAVFVGRRTNDDYEAYVRELVTDWNYTEERARLLSPATMEWMAVPFYDELQDRVDAVLYLDVNRRAFFTEPRQELVLAALRGIAVFVGKRYS
jgi:hypothetical protein